MQGFRVSILLLTTATVVLGPAAACSPTVRDGWFTCAGPAECPSGFSCTGGVCRRGGGTECRIDLHCEDGDFCTLDVCEDGTCLHEPQDGACDDGDFCNGPDACSAGVCANVGPAPCPGTCSPFGCEGCGSVGLPCCDGVCGEGACDGTTCVPCGGTDGPCCGGAFPCTEPGATCDGTSCVRCGADGQVCCAGGFCSPGLSCDGSSCGPAAGCGGVSCPSSSVCVGGSCVPCGDVGQACCTTGCTRGVCNAASGFCEVRTCGGRDQACCGAAPDCDPGLACATDATGVGAYLCRLCGTTAGDPCCPPTSGLGPCASTRLTCDSFGPPTCVPCGEADQPCCAGTALPCPAAGAVCVAGTCRSGCGGLDQPCCPLNHCMPGLLCRSSTCRAE